jgi:hypothetical protein
LSPNSWSTPDCGWRNSQPVSATGRNLLSAAPSHALDGFHRRGSGIGATPLDDRFHETAQGTGKGLDERRNSTDRESFVPSLGAFPAFCHVCRQTTAEGQHLTRLGGNIHAEIPGVGARKRETASTQNGHMPAPVWRPTIPCHRSRPRCPGLHSRHRGAAADPGPLVRRAVLDIRAVKSSILERNVLRIEDVFAL